MTTIACTKTEMSGDLCYSNTTVKFKGGPKLAKCKPHELHWPHSEFIIGFAGVAGEMVELMDFYQHPENYGGKLPRIRDIRGLVLTADGQIFFFDTPRTWMKVDMPYYSIGSGAPMALGALSVGATSREAVLAAGKTDPFTGFGAKTFKFT